MSILALRGESAIEGSLCEQVAISDSALEVYEHDHLHAASGTELEHQVPLLLFLPVND